MLNIIIYRMLVAMMAIGDGKLVISEAAMSAAIGTCALATSVGISIHFLRTVYGSLGDGTVVSSNCRIIYYIV